MWFNSSFTTPAVVAISFCLIGRTVPAAADIPHVPGDFPTIQTKAPESDAENALRFDGGDDCVEPRSDLVGWWPGDGDVGDIAGCHTGTILGGMGFGEGMVEQAFSLDDVNDGVEIPNTDGVYDLVDEWTVDAWVFPFAPGWDLRNDPIVWKTGNGNKDTFYIAWGCVDDCSNNDRNRFVTGLERASDGQDFKATSEPHLPGDWYHVAGVYDGTDLIIYVDGREEGRNTIGSIIAYTTPDPLTIGNILHTDHANAGVFDGLIDEVEIFDRALLAEEIAAIYLAGSAGKCKPNCPWDLDCNNEVGVADMLILLDAWGPNKGHPADFDGSGDVGVSDFLELLGNWGPCP